MKRGDVDSRFADDVQGGEAQLFHRPPDCVQNLQQSRQRRCQAEVGRFRFPIPSATSDSVQVDRRLSLARFDTLLHWAEH